MIRRAVFSIVMLCASVGSTALAQPQASSSGAAPGELDPGDLARARQHFERAERLFATRDFEAAALAYRAAYDAAPLPELLFNIAQCYRQLQRYDAAIFGYQKYLLARPDAGNRAYVEQTIAELERARSLDASRRLDLVTGEGTLSGQQPASPASAALYRRWWFVTGAVLVAGAATATAIVWASDGVPSSDLGTLDFRKR